MTLVDICERPMVVSFGAVAAILVASVALSLERQEPPRDAEGRSE